MPCLYIYSVDIFCKIFGVSIFAVQKKNTSALLSTLPSISAYSGRQYDDNLSCFDAFSRFQLTIYSLILNKRKIFCRYQRDLLHSETAFRNDLLQEI